MQLSLPILQIDEDTFENFYTENNEGLLASLRQNFVEVQQPFFYICIEQNRTKLLNSFRAYKSTQDIRIIGSIYLQREEKHCYND